MKKLLIPAFLGLMIILVLIQFREREEFLAEPLSKQKPDQPLVAKKKIIKIETHTRKSYDIPAKEEPSIKEHLLKDPCNHNLIKKFMNSKEGMTDKVKTIETLSDQNEGCIQLTKHYLMILIKEKRMNHLSHLLGRIEWSIDNIEDKDLADHEDFLPTIYLVPFDKLEKYEKGARLLSKFRDKTRAILDSREFNPSNKENEEFYIDYNNNLYYLEAYFLFKLGKLDHAKEAFEMIHYKDKTDSKKLWKQSINEWPKKELIDLL